MKFKSSNQRKAVMAKLRSKLVSNQSIPALTGSLGNAQPKDKALAFRVWVRHKKGGDDELFIEKASLTEAKAARTRAIKSKEYAKVEPVIGVFKKNVKKFPSQKWWEARLK